MGRRLWFRGALLAVGLLLGPLLSGCFVPLGAAWPNVAVTPALQASASNDQVHAFRVAVREVDATIEFHEPGEYVLREVPVFAGGWVSPQADVGCDYGWYWNCIALSYWKLKQHTVMVRLYRPGCQTVEVGAWDLPHEVKWTGVADLAGQEKAVDDLVCPGTADFWQDVLGQEGGGAARHGVVFRCLAAGSKSPEHRKALLFAASEYKRLAKAAPPDPTSRAIAERMEKKAAFLGELAEK